MSTIGAELNMDSQETSLESKAHNLMLRGRSLNSGEHFNQEAFDLLSKAIKLNPYLIDAWIDLTKCYQRKSDIEGAIACLENALKYCDAEKPNKIILRKLSTCIRQQTCDSQEAKIASLLRSLDLSKQALKSDLCDQENYYNLAKAYMCLFFVTECVDHQLINLSKAAYVKAITLSNESFSRKRAVDDGLEGRLEEKVPKPSNDDSDDESKPFIEQPDFLFNFSTVLIYLQEFQKALEYLRLAIKLDPKWNEPQVLEECLVDYLKQIQSMMHELCKSNKKVIRRYSKIVEALKNVNNIEAIIKIDQQRLLKSQNIKVKSITLDQLNSVSNQSGKASKIEGMAKNGSVENNSRDTVELLHLKLVNTINYNQAMYLTFIAIDENYSLTVVTIYNLAASRYPTQRDVVTIVEPKLESIMVDNLFDGKSGEASFSFKRINVREFKDLYVNGYRITTDQVSKPQFRVSVLP